METLAIVFVMIGVGGFLYVGMRRVEQDLKRAKKSLDELIKILEQES